VTHIIHNGWAVNFNASLSFFEPNVKTLRNLTDLALLSPLKSVPKLIFLSTIGVTARKYHDHMSVDLYAQSFGDLDRSTTVHEAEIPPLTVAGSGYPESKWVGEKLCAIAAERTALRPTCIRIGQLCGTKTGAWNAWEWLPSLIRSSVYLKCLPSWDIVSGTV
jgi:thioester reductase-like protein